ncbi:hypothetical protein [Allorhizocola rhizosphaerae]|uniref:hypothetical protein n=1 Tax=Allorhizocola rhizosphaerae TaxID=1872709 RepID=UPI000E3BFBBC|nr:hypothetical protein [Allorhizocola rhizosphaerae]
MRELFDPLRAEAQRQILPEPVVLRARSDRRAARRLATGVLAAVLMLSGGYYAVRPDPRANFEVATSRTPPHSAVPSPIPSVSPACRDTYRKEIPAEFFVPGGTEICFDPVVTDFFVESVPTPCRPDAGPTDALIEDRRGFENVVTEDKSSGPTAIHQVLTRYSGQGATQALSNLTRDVGRCGPFATSELRLSYTVVSSDANSVRLKAKYEALKKADTGPPESTYLVVVRRIGNYVAVVYDKGWDGYPSQDGTLQKFYETFVQAIPPT